jgi:hypothetical protein
MELDVQVKLAVYRHFAETGRGPSPEEVARRAGADVESVLAAYRRLRAQRVLVLEADESSIRMAPPFSGVPTPHVVEASDVRYSPTAPGMRLGCRRRCTDPPRCIHAARRPASRCA